MLEYEKGGGCLKVRVKPILGEHDFISFDCWMQRMYFPPNTRDKYWDTYYDEGYDAYLRVAYPDIWAPADMTFKEAKAWAVVDYEWHRIEDAMGSKASPESLEHFLEGNRIVTPVRPYQNKERLQRLKIALGSSGVLVWVEVGGRLCIFVNDNDDIVPVLMSHSACEILDDTFGGFG